ncbi:serine hydrolase domain-containing protein [Mycolicibacterium hippocampi]|uniref:Beta-lactamase class C-like and penicillin binding proteins (PBPs) superfamily n=1 Tax=Mycolicibacterium hippocampi TaxID=659824 RepID=A0A850PCY8_9MYCO|nr:serine hydrolase domain-containing protein [Mycolicibacterium hippocampi]NVN48359.1 Beta-lactamase class C-like and penicillin binding proteins (PBPs) superfamily [Mycolicibacterium hippocampi]
MIARVCSLVLVLMLAATGCAGSPGETRQEEPPAADSVPATTMDADVTARLNGVVSRAMDHAEIPGAIVGIWGPEGDYVRAFGVADKKTRAPMKADLYSRIGSQTKTFTVTAALILADEGKIGLDDRIGEYVTGVPRGGEITVRQLARMQSGLANYSASPAFQQALFDDPQRSFTPQDLLGFAFAEPATFAPGEGFEYSNTNTVLLGLLVERVTGQALAEYIKGHILGPLGMSQTHFPADSYFPEAHAEGYTTQTADGGETTATDWNPSWAWAAGAMISTLHDMRVWAPALATGTLLTPQMQAQRLETVAAPGLPPQDGYGMGLFTLGGWIGHNGSLPGYQTVSVYLPENRTALVILINTDIPFGDAEPGTVLATAITRALTPDHVYTLN